MERSHQKTLGRVPPALDWLQKSASATRSTRSQHGLESSHLRVEFGPVKRAGRRRETGRALQPLITPTNPTTQIESGRREKPNRVWWLLAAYGGEVGGIILGTT
ncbi:hypothetical protein PIB30_007285 [Stylosanthes scabra]|uniref:Uncharacterized protein n=1 Tax=Stylosanthes scabra TaxID=79078 RepID=A0ABU6W7R1_9FABA|nr:hypothetical protein [Stylosanthes scabra]